MKVLIACEFSGVVRDAFLARGHDAWSCDILPTESPGQHITGDVRPVLHSRWDMVIAHPPCTFLCNSGVRWLKERPERWDQMMDGLRLFVACLNANAKYIAVENPVMHKYARERVGRGPDFTVQPWQFGDNLKKRTCFWTVGLPPLVPTSDLDGSTAEAAVHRMPPSANRGKLRSITPRGIAEAMADQWGAVA